MITLVIHGQPVSKKNSMQLAKIRGRYFPVPSASYRRWMRIAKPQVKAQIAPDGLPPVRGLPINRPIHLRVMAYRWTRRKIDLSNIYAAVEDMLQKYGVLADDELVWSHDGSRKILGVPKDEARVEIEIEELGA
jgi:Holliday junction resolvase RusA-like endonuclease